MEVVGEYEFLTLDVETANQNRRSICQMAVVGYLSGECHVLIDRFVDPKEDFGFYQTRKHGIAAGNVEDAPTFADLYELFVSTVQGRPVFCHSNFDQQAIDAACNFHQLPLVDVHWIDSCHLAKRLLPGQSAKLKSLCEHYGVEFEHHDAMEDAIATAKVLGRLMDEFNLSVSKCASIAGFERSNYYSYGGNKYESESITYSAISIEVCQVEEFVGKEIVLTGRFIRGSKSDIGRLAKAAGFEIKNTLTRTSQFLVYGVGADEGSGSLFTGKHKKAVDYNERHNQGIIIWSEHEFFEILSSSQST